MAQEPMVMCPTCRTAVLQRVYYRHAEECQKAAAAESRKAE